MLAQRRPNEEGTADIASSFLSEYEWRSDQSPAELVCWSSISSNQQVAGFIRYLTKTYPDRLHAEPIGQSAGGRPVVAVRVGPTRVGDELRPTVLVFAQQHGDEPAGMEACLLLIRDLVSEPEDSAMARLDIWVVPQVNPDGAETGSRRNSRRIDLNRGHQLLRASEQQALYGLYHRLRPHVTIDLHEYDVEEHAFSNGSALAAYDLMADVPTNPNVGRAIRDLALDGLDAVDGALASRGFRFRRYVRGDPSETDGRGLRYSTLHVFDGRNTPAILGSIAFIVEATRHRDILARLERRVSCTYWAVRSLLQFAVEHAPRLLEAVAADRLSARKRDLALRAEYHPAVTGSDFRYAYIRPETGETGDYSPRWAATSVVVTRERPLPLAYWISAGLDRRSSERLFCAIRGHNLTLSTLSASTRAHVETLTIDTVSEPNPADGRRSIEVTSRIAKRVVPEGSLILRADQYGSRLAGLLLEPDSMDGLLASGAWILAPGRRYPVRRIVRFSGESPVALEIS